MSLNPITQTFDGVAAKHLACVCGISFAVPASLFQHHLTVNNGSQVEPIYCPRGCKVYWTGGTAEQKRITELERANASIASLKDYWQRRSGENATRADHERRSAIATRGQKTRILNRIKKGECPVCRKKFPDLGKHMHEHAAIVEGEA